MNVLLRLLFCTTIFLAPWYVVRGSFFGIPFTLLEVSILVTFAVFLIRIIKERRLAGIIEIFKSQHWYVYTTFTLFLLSAVVGVLISPDKKAALGILKAYIVEPLLFGLILIVEIRKPKELLMLLWSMFVSGFVVGMIALGQKITGFNAYAPMETEIGRVTGVFNSGNALSLFLAPIVIIGFAFIADQFVHHSIDATAVQRKQTMVVVALTVFNATIVYFSQSKGGTLALLLSVLIVIGLVLSYPQKLFYTLIFEHKRLWRVLLALYVAIQLVFFSVVVPKLTPKSSTYPPVRITNDTTMIRLCLWEGTVKVLGNYGLLGVGLSGFPNRYAQFLTCDPELLQYPHNVLLNFWVELGLGGLLAVIGFLALYFQNLMKFSVGNILDKEKRKPFVFLQIGLFGVLLYFLIHGLVDVPFFKNDLSLYFFIFLAFSYLITIISQER